MVFIMQEKCMFLSTLSVIQLTVAPRQQKRFISSLARPKYLFYPTHSSEKVIIVNLQMPVILSTLYCILGDKN